MSIASAILDVLTGALSEVSTSEVLDTVVEQEGTTPQTVKNELRTLVASGAITRPRHGYYSLPKGGAFPGGDSAPDRLSTIPLASLHVSAGAGSIVYATEVEAYVSVDEYSIRRETGVSPDSLVLIVATGDSMLPTISPGDRLWVARTNGEPVRDGAVYIWRSRYDGIAVKRARLLPDGLIALQGDSEAAPVGNISPRDDDPAWSIVGRVIRVEKPL